MSHSTSDLTAGINGLLVDNKRKKRSQRAFHNIQGGYQLNHPTPSLPNVHAPGGAEHAHLQSEFLSPKLQGSEFLPRPPFTPFAHSNLSHPNFLPNYQGFPSIPSTPAAMNQFPTSFQSPTASPASHRHVSGAERHLGDNLPRNLHDQFSQPATLNITNPREASAPPPELSLSHARYILNMEYSSPVFDEATQSEQYKAFLSFQNIVPPVAGTQYHAVDQGTSTPKHMRCTMYNVPESEALRKGTRLPLAVTIRPFAPLLASEEPVPCVDMSKLGEETASDPMDVGPPRCNRCRTYINPAMMHSISGRFTCNVCQFPNNAVPDEYVASVDPSTNQRLDRMIRPELHKGVYDIIVPSYYNVGGAQKSPHKLHHVFLFDISQPSIAKQLPILLADALRAALFDYDSEETASFRFAIILFDKALHFYNLSPTLDTVQVYTSGDLDDPFVPFSEGLFADPETSRNIIEDALNNMELLCDGQSAPDSEPCLSVALRTAALCLDQVGGGKITAVLSTLPSWGPGASKIKQNRTVGRAQLAEAEKALYSPDSEYYKLLAKDFVSQNVGLDVFMICDTPLDVSNIGWLASITGGKVSKWPNFVFERDGRSLTSQIMSSIKKCAGYQGQLKLRCSNGLQVAQYYGFPTASGEGIVGLTNATLNDPVVPSLHEDQTFTVLLEYDGTLNTKYDCHFQAALLYTDVHGVRKVRVINLVLAVSERLVDVFNFVDQDAVVTTIVRDTLSFIGKETIHELRKSLNEKLVEVFTQYRLISETSHNRNATLTNQLIFPDLMKNLPSYFLALIKSKALRDSSAQSVDLRLCDVYQMLFMPMEKLCYHLYGALVELHSLAEDECMPIADDANVNGFLRLPEFKPLTHAVVENGVYILCNAIHVYVRVHPESNTLLLQDLFGKHVQSVHDIDPLLDSLPELPTHISLQARNMVAYFHENIVGSAMVDSQAIVIVRDGIDANTVDFRDCLVEDMLPSKTASTSPNYVEFVASLHKAVRVKLDSEKPKKATAGADSLAQRMIHF